jgi:protein ImuB
MFACIYSRSVQKSQQKPETDEVKPASSLIDLAFTFSPLVEQTSADTAVVDVSGQGLLFGPTGASPDIDCVRNIANEITRQSKLLGLNINVAIAANIDVAIHAARLLKGVTIIPAGDELVITRDFSIKQIDHSLVAIDEKRALEIQDTFALWGIRTFGDFARLPLAGVAERLGQEGVRLRELASGKSHRRLNLVCPPLGFAQSFELEHAISEVEPLSFVLSRLLNQLCANLNEYALATNEIKLALKLHGESQYEREITLPVPIRNPKTLLRLLLFEIEREPPQAPIIAVAITAEPIKPRATQTGLFIPLAPEAERLEITLARLAKLVGADNVGSPEILDTHRPDSFRMQRFTVATVRKKRHSNPRPAISNPQCVMGFRIFRPPWRAEVHTVKGQPVRIEAQAKPSGKVSGRIIRAAGPWRTSGDWWRSDVWARDEWDVTVCESSQSNEMLCRIYWDLTSEQWFIAGVYD